MKDLRKMLNYMIHPNLNSIARIMVLISVVVIISLLSVYSFTRYPVAEVSPTVSQVQIPVWSPTSSLTFGYSPIPLYVPLMPVPTLDASVAAAIAPVVIPFPEPSPEIAQGPEPSSVIIVNEPLPVFVPPVTIEPVLATPAPPVILPLNPAWTPPVTTVRPVTITSVPAEPPQATPQKPAVTRTWLQSLARSFHDNAKGDNQNDNNQGDNEGKGKNNGKGKGAKGKD